MTSDALSLSGLSIERLRSFCEIVKAGSASLAAGGNPSKQSQYSRQISDLERVLGTELFVHEGKRQKLTSAGLRLAALTNAYFNGLLEISIGSDGVLPPLKLGAAESVVRWILVPRLNEVVSIAGSAIELGTHRTAEVVSRLESGQIDVGIMREDAKTDSIETLPFQVMRYVLMVPRSLLPGKSAAGIQAIKVLPLVEIMGDGQFVAASERVVEANHLSLKILTRVQSFGLAIEVAKALGAATFIPAQAEREFSSELFTPVTLNKIGAMDRRLVVAYGKKTAELNSRAQRLAVRISRAYAGSL